MEAPRKLTPELIAAIEALQEKGIPATEAAVSKWIEEHKPKPGQTQRPSRVPQAIPEAPAVTEANLAPFTPAELEQLSQPGPEPQPARRNLGGRSPKEEPWLEPAAKLVAGGMALRQALKSLGIPFTNQDLNNVQRLVRFRHYLEKHRHGP